MVMSTSPRLTEKQHWSFTTMLTPADDPATHLEDGEEQSIAGMPSTWWTTFARLFDEHKFLDYGFVSIFCLLLFGMCG